MPKKERTAWVKNVYSLRMSGGKDGAPLSPTHLLISKKLLLPVQNNPFIHHTIATLTTYFSTAKIARLSLLMNGFTHLPQDLLIEPRKVNLKR